MTTNAEELTPRQKKVLDLLKKGKTAKQIAASLKITTNAVYQYRRRFVERGLLKDEKPKVASAKRTAREQRTIGRAAVSDHATLNGRSEVLTQTHMVLDERKGLIGAALEENNGELVEVKVEREKLDARESELIAEAERLTKAEEAVALAEKALAPA